MTKVCSECRIEKDLENFNKDKTRKDNHSVYCKDCSKKKWKDYQITNIEKLKQKYKKDKLKNPNYIKVWYQKNPNYNSNYEKNRRMNDPLFYILKKCRNRIRDYFRLKNEKKNKNTIDLIGCSPLELKKHIENKFMEGMNWENRNQWHIDHIIPLSSAQSEKELYDLCHYTNLQPLWAEDNIKKGNKILSPLN